MDSILRLVDWYMYTSIMHRVVVGMLAANHLRHQRADPRPSTSSTSRSVIPSENIRTATATIADIISDIAASPHTASHSAFLSPCG